jgi:hypothetical protein
MVDLHGFYVPFSAKVCQEGLAFQRVTSSGFVAIRLPARNGGGCSGNVSGGGVLYSLVAVIACGLIRLASGEKIS